MNKTSEMDIANILKEKSEVIALSLVTYQFQLRPEEWGRYGTNGIEVSLRDARYLLDYLYESIVANEPQILVNYSLWADELFKGLKLPDNTMRETLESLRIIISREFPELHYKVSHIIDETLLALRANQKHLLKNNSQPPLNEQANKYIDLLLNGNRHGALQLIDQLSNQEGVTVRDIYLEIFQPAQHQIGQLWLQGKISVAKEHYCTAVTQQAMSMLYPKIFTTQRKNLSFVAACVGNELHEIGIRMVADFFEMDGWDTYYLGANTPADSIVKAVNEQNADLLGLSIALPIHRSILKDVIEQIKPMLQPKTKIIIGGYALNQTNVNPTWFGAHAYAPDALKAVEVGNTITA